MTWVMSSYGGAVSVGRRTTWGGWGRRAGQRTAHQQAWGCLGTRLGAGSETLGERRQCVGSFSRKLRMGEGQTEC
eukprot:2772695-Rhodomonas_salina.1